ncbi:hypothetical protein SERLA73DRAFT_183352 [Serpula lacrymans var. lacrymans S7.3]|uniref:Yeast cell wall synthesis Kre9/Knh1-like N-terminal domain-containing protein n=2 Tax=Serpula lacrymans var. lacrymans TaxID=341189 RepID=F8PZQ9_SERL3|nr:uncharacterized protein SERLADRAFT_470443 [Serpula lacrymans var. lacrymans S7.9]EGN98381.1 hypothetical protein SERLA73DRAFT_183352 [Serpula lacrymans var. lacrymans S7.3]EGO23933.1 hypothetical protein SERLADRAFT_470443 [Serpula lacrymans var. lacrymans S7.9]
MIMTPFTTFLLTLLSLFAFAIALPISNLQARDVFVPPILYPHAGTVWQAGNHHNVTWDISGAPVNITNKVGMVILATNGLEDIEHPLASNFNILDGRVEIQVPDVPTGNNYAIVLFGDSGNFSPNFTIIN